MAFDISKWADVKSTTVPEIAQGEWADQYTELHKYVGFDIVKINDKDISDAFDLRDTMTFLNAEKNIVFTVQRKGTISGKWRSLHYLCT